ncbi:MAG: hypothetical protein DMG05_09745 [Acidobacteria bacterium]|nr:MAG: hypothetical protein DMG05_09745 [Acidobacteriota bacterium]
MKNNRILSFLPLSVPALLLITLFPAAHDKPNTGLSEAETFFLQGDLSEAKRVLQDSLRKQPNFVAALDLLANLYLLEDNFEAATQEIRRAMKLAPNNPKGLATYGHCLFREGDFKLAEIQFRKCLQLDPKQAAAYLGLGRLHLTKLRPEEGLEALQQAIRLDPNQEDNYFLASEAYGTAKNLSMQIQSLEKYLAFKPKFHAERVQNAEALLTFFRSLEKGPVAKINHPARRYEIPVQPFYGLMLVEAHVNGDGPYRFLVDSGATSTVLSNALLEHLKIAPIARAVVKCVGGTGKTATQLCKAARFQMGALEIENLPVASFDNEIFAGLIDGVLSTADLGDFLVILDYPDRKILLTPRPSSEPPAPAQSGNTPSTRSEFRILGNLMLVPVSINHQAPKNFLFDTGAVTSTLSKRQAALLGVHENTPNSVVDLQFAGACGVTQSVLSVSTVDLGLHGLKRDYAQILAVELKEISKEIQTEVSGILGGDFFSKYKVTLDYHNTTVTIE